MRLFGACALTMWKESIIIMEFQQWWNNNISRFALIHARIQVFLSGGWGMGGGGSICHKKKSLTRFFLYFVYFLVLNLFYRSPMVYLKKKFQGPRGVQHFSRGWDVPTFFQRGVQYSNCLFHKETHITCVFPGGFWTPCPSPLPCNIWINWMLWK